MRNGPHLRHIKFEIDESMLGVSETLMASVRNPNCPCFFGNLLNGGVQILSEERPSHDDPHIQNPKRLLELAVAVVVPRHVEARHRVRVAPHRKHRVPRPRVKLLPRHLPRRLRRANVAAGRQCRHAHVGVSTVLRNGVEERRGLPVHRRRVEVVGGRNAAGRGGFRHLLRRRGGESSGDSLPKVISARAKKCSIFEAHERYF